MGDSQTEGKCQEGKTADERRLREMKYMPRILTLDGGGVRGLSSLLILQKLRSYTGLLPQYFKRDLSYTHIVSNIPPSTYRRAIQNCSWN